MALDLIVCELALVRVPVGVYQLARALPHVVDVRAAVDGALLVEVGAIAVALIVHELAVVLRAVGPAELPDARVLLVDEVAAVEATVLEAQRAVAVPQAVDPVALVDHAAAHLVVVRAVAVPLVAAPVALVAFLEQRARIPSELAVAVLHVLPVVAVIDVAVGVVKAALAVLPIVLPLPGVFVAGGALVVHLPEAAHPVELEVALVDAPVGPGVEAAAVLHAELELAGVLGAPVEVEDALTVDVVVLPVAHVSGAVGPDVRTAAVALVLRPLADVDVPALLVPVDAVAVGEVLLPVPVVHVAVGKVQAAGAKLHVHEPVPHVDVAVGRL
mmetsp:Transcript_35453/g.111572  ORF Transcript_35453/g.111572 Transcript_35453/m.111572 type:complete len:329 (-) Transcript_35453:1356-2342(-)